MLRMMIVKEQTGKHSLPFRFTELKIELTILKRFQSVDLIANTLGQIQRVTESALFCQSN